MNKINQLLPYIPTNNITELNEVIYAGEKLVCEKTGIPAKSTKKKSKPVMMPLNHLLRKCKGSKQRNCYKQLHTDNMPTNDVEAQIREEIYYSLTIR